QYASGIFIIPMEVCGTPFDALSWQKNGMHAVALIHSRTLSDWPLIRNHLARRHDKTIYVFCVFGAMNRKIRRYLHKFKFFNKLSDVKKQPWSMHDQQMAVAMY